MKIRVRGIGPVDIAYAALLATVAADAGEPVEVGDAGLWLTVNPDREVLVASEQLTLHDTEPPAWAARFRTAVANIHHDREETP